MAAFSSLVNLIDLSANKYKKSSFKRSLNAVSLVILL